MERELVLLRAGRQKYLSVVPATDVSKPRIAIERIESMPKCIPIEWLFTLVQDENTVQLYPVSVPGAALNIHTVTSGANNVRSSVESLSGQAFIKSKNKLIPVNAQPGLRSLTLVPTTVALGGVANHVSHPTTPPYSAKKFSELVEQRQRLILALGAIQQLTSMATPDPSPRRLSMLSPGTAHVRDAPQHLGSPIELEAAVSTGIATPTRGRTVEGEAASTPQRSPCRASPSRIPSAIARSETGGVRLPRASPLHPVFHGNSRDSYATVDSFPDEFGSGNPPSLCGSEIDFELPMRPLDSPSRDDADWQSDVGSQSTFSDTIAGLRRLTTASQRRLGFRSRTSGAREGEDWAKIGGSVGGGLLSSLDRAWMVKASSSAVPDARPLRASAPVGLLSRQETCIRAGTVRPLRLQGGEGLAVSLPDGLWPSAPLRHKRSLFLSRQLLDASDPYQ